MVTVTRLLALALAVAAWAVLSAPVQAQEPPAAPARVFNATPYPILVNGERVFGSPAIVTLGSLVCVSTSVGYLGDSERQVFQGWSHGAQDECVRFSAPGDYNVIYNHEVLLQVRSKLKEYRQSKWVPRGTRARLEVPNEVEERPGVRYRFEEWDGGETPFQVKNVVAPLRGLTVEVKWSKEYYLSVAGPDGAALASTGWYREGQPIVLGTAPFVDGPGKDERRRFVQWEGVGASALVIPSAQSAVTSLSLTDTQAVQAKYRQEYLVVVENPQGILKKEWVAQGETFVLETPAIIEVTPERERQSFKEWAGADLKSAKGSVTVNRAQQFKAIYDREFMVTVNSAYGASGGGWHKEGTMATIRVPQNPAGILFLKSVFDGFPGYTATGPALETRVTGPLTITATYKRDVDVKILAIVLAVLAVAGIGYLATQKRVQVILARMWKSTT